MSENQHIDFVKIENTPEFRELRRKKYRFIFPIPILFLFYYLLFPILSAYAGDLMSTFVIGNLTFGYLFGISYYLVIWILAFIYVMKARQFDRMAEEIVKKYGPENEEV